MTPKSYALIGPDSHEAEPLTLDHETLKDLDATAHVLGGWWATVLTSSAPVSGDRCNQTNNAAANTSGG